MEKTPLAVQLEKYLKENGVTQVFICKKLGISHPHMSNWLAGRVPMSMKLQKKIQEFLEGKI